MIRYTDFDEIFKAVDRAADALITDFYAAYTEAKKIEKKKAVEKPKTNLDKKATNTSKKNVKLSPPWTTIEKFLAQMFEGDDDITIYPMIRKEDGSREIVIESNYADKICALSELLNNEYDFGNVKLKITYRVTNKYCFTKNTDLYGTVIDALASTPRVEDIKKIRNFVEDEFIVIEFAKEVIQFFNDDLQDYYGNWNGTLVDVAKKIFKSNDKILFTIAETKE